jgi:2-dehydropantoate 2-reductase
VSPSGPTSLLQAVEAGRRTEADLFGGTVIGMARARGVNVPVNEFLFKCIRAIEKSYMQ